MERNLYTDDFERLIRQKADQYKMYPSDKVWKGINQSLHGRRKWRWAGLALLLIGIGGYTGNWYLADKSASQLASNMQPSIDAASRDFAGSITPAGMLNPNQGRPRYSPLRAIQGFLGTRTQQQSTDPNDFQQQSQGISEANGNDDGFAGMTSFSSEHDLLIVNDEENTNALVTGSRSSTKVNTPSPASLLEKEEAKEQSEEAEVKTQSNLADAASESVLKKDKLSINWLEEFAVFQLKPSKPQRLGLQVYFSPTVNYRKLSGSTYFPSSEVDNIPLKPTAMGDVDQFVKHKPALGFEVGSNILYRASKRVTFKAGLQFNYSRYNIDAYSSQPEIATIALSTTTLLADTISTYSNLRNLSGESQEELSNQYFQLSMPIGLEFRVIGSEKLQLNVAGTIQPTYLLNRNSYLITTDYKNYMREPSLVRRWNVNAGLETYISYNTGTVRWQIGPQFRYQLLSTYSRKYPIKEQLMEYGFKIGVSKMIR
jgi:hypothetical protein